MKKNILDVWNPRYHDRTILVNPRKCIRGTNYVQITKDKDYQNKLLKFHSDILDKYPAQKNGKGIVVAIPLSQFEVILK